jgi:Pvc16 N-terminal domain
MIENAFLLLQKELQEHLQVTDASTTVIIDNIAMLGTASGDSLSNSIVLTLVNTEERAALKWQNILRRFLGLNTSVGTTRDPLNLYILFTSNYAGISYQNGLSRLDHIIRFFQNKTLFSASPVGTTATANTVNLRFTLEYYRLGFKRANQLWGSLGGRQMPFVMYKLRFVSNN